MSGAEHEPHCSPALAQRTAAGCGDTDVPDGAVATVCFVPHLVQNGALTANGALHEWHALSLGASTCARMDSAAEHSECEQTPHTGLGCGVPHLLQNTLSFLSAAAHLTHLAFFETVAVRPERRLERRSPASAAH